MPKEEQDGAIDAERSLAILHEHRRRLAAKAEELSRLVDDLDMKIAWVGGGSKGAPLTLGAYLRA